MKVFIVGGFLGSGKTTLLMKMAERVSGKAVLLINEVGEVGVDGATVKAGGYNAVELPNGCICCSLSGSLQTALREIKKDYDPELILIEPTGLALPHKVKDLVRISMIDPDETTIIGVCDAYRFTALAEKKENFLRMQLNSSDYFLLNKMDAADGTSVAAARAWLHSLKPDAPIYKVSGLTGEGIEEAFEAIGI